MQRSTCRHQVRFDIMGLCCAVKHHLPQADIFFSLHTCHQGSVETWGHR